MSNSESDYLKVSYSTCFLFLVEETDSSQATTLIAKNAVIACFELKDLYEHTISLTTHSILIRMTFKMYLK